jgi:hypothetical protein
MFCLKASSSGLAFAECCTLDRVPAAHCVLRPAPDRLCGFYFYLSLAGLSTKALESQAVVTGTEPLTAWSV